MVPMGLFLVVGPMFAAGRGVRPFVLSLATGWGMVLLVALLNARATLDLLGDWRENLPALAAFAALAVMSGSMGGLVLLARWLEERQPGVGRCRRCGYDLRESPQRCPECGTPVRREPEQV